METYIISVNGVKYEVQVEKKGASAAPAVVSAPASAASASPKSSANSGSVRVEAGAAGKVWKIVAKPGDALKAGDSVVILEAMKMEIPVVAPKDGVVASIDCNEGQPCEAGDLLATLN